MQTIDNRKDILLLMLYSPGTSEDFNEPIVGRTRLVKMLFLFKKEALKHFRQGTKIDEENFYEFFPWDFGPFSVQVYDDLNFFILRDFVESSESEEESLPESAEEWERWFSRTTEESVPENLSTYGEEKLRLTGKGLAFAKELYEILSRAQRKLLRQFKRRTNAAPLRALLRYVYTNYDEMTAKSQIKEKVLGEHT